MNESLFMIKEFQASDKVNQQQFFCGNIQIRQINEIKFYIFIDKQLNKLLIVRIAKILNLKNNRVIGWNQAVVYFGLKKN
ncbi:hypothetical protein BpHYR1_033624 [Brachionus plicatilis]|uniref:Uncharacterized protein n=1 Tax=Brachionus plicatilis TaxID=10195 RepID=A0A3M7SYL6_BRAPC|nr:hypothetical protein BpHYR1_033624 [Brachionus plicatilis]